MKRILIGKIIGSLGIIIFAMGISYLITYQLEKTNYQDIKIIVTFEDTKTFKLENTNKLTKEEALKTYPYIFKVLNEGKKTKYDITININNQAKENLNYLLYEDLKLVKEGNLNDLKNNLLYTTTINKNQTKTYKCYVYGNQELTENYQYQIKINSKK